MYRAGQLLYVEEAIAEHPRVKAIISRLPPKKILYCHRYTEIFNRKAQSFRLQKQQPALILAKKHRNHLLPIPKHYGLGARHNYYFSHMLNCPYDCRYCFLQGMYRSAHYLLFVNYQDFADAIGQKIRQHPNDTIHFFSGYDSDSLAFEPISGFVDFFLPVFEQHANALLELRTKSTQIRSLLNRQPIDNIVIAFSFTPIRLAKALEHKTPTVQKRLQAMVKLQEYGWQIGLRFDPLIYDRHFKQHYSDLFTRLFERLDQDQLHSVSLGSFRLPSAYFRTIRNMYPDELLFASLLEEKNGMVSYPRSLANDMIQYCENSLLKLIPAEKYFPCHES